MVTAITSIVASVGAAVSAIVSAIALVTSSKTQQKVSDSNKRQLTISAFNYLQEQVLDKFVTFTKQDVKTMLDTMDDSQMREAYNDCRAMIAKCEHFAVGVNTDIYDFDTVYKLGGIHLVYLFEKIKPIINMARNSTTDGEQYYREFEALIDKLKVYKPTK